MAINLVTQCTDIVDEIFKAESKKSLVTNDDYDWTGAHSILINKVNTVDMNDYDREGTGATASRYGDYGAVENTLEELMLKNDRSFTFVIDKLDEDETKKVLSATTALSRQQREVIIPEIDTYTYGVMAENAGTIVDTVTLDEENIYDEITKATEALDNSEVPETNRVLIVSPASYRLLKKSAEVVLNSNVGEDMRLKGVIGNLDGMTVVKVPATRLPENFGFMVAHPSACVAPVKLEDYKAHNDPPGISGTLLEGRICYDAFVLDNKANGIYYLESAIANSGGSLTQ